MPIAEHVLPTYQGRVKLAKLDVAASHSLTRKPPCLPSLAKQYSSQGSKLILSQPLIFIVNYSIIRVGSNKEMVLVEKKMTDEQQKRYKQQMKAIGCTNDDVQSGDVLQDELVPAVPAYAGEPPTDAHVIFGMLKMLSQQLLSLALNVNEDGWDVAYDTSIQMREQLEQFEEYIVKMGTAQLGDNKDLPAVAQKIRNQVDDMFDRLKQRPADDEEDPEAEQRDIIRQRDELRD